MGSMYWGNDLTVANLAAFFDQHFYSGKAPFVDMEYAYYCGICKILTQMRYYQEEGERIQFRLAIGNFYKSSFCDQNKVLGPLPNRYKLFSKVSDGSLEDVIKTTEKAIKKVLPCCKDNTDIYILLKETPSDDPNVSFLEIESGIYFLELGRAQKTAEVFLDSGFILAECVPENMIVLNYKTGGTKEKSVIQLEIRDARVAPVLTDMFEGCNSNNSYWRNVFERVKRNCHGTICLIVDSDFDINDKAFTSELVNKDPIIIEDVNIGPLKEGEKADQNLQLFFSLLNYDGFTIIDNTGRVLSYNNICALHDVNNNSGGSRHKAFDQMKLWGKDNPALLSHLIGIYFQSQEGETVFFDYHNQTALASCVSESCFKIDHKKRLENEYTIVGNIKLIEQSTFTTTIVGEQIDYNNYYNAILYLQGAHRGFNNFFNEKPAADVVLSYFSRQDWLNLFCSTFTSDSRYIRIRKATLDAVFSCLIGNYYGYAESAQDVLLEILKRIPFTWVKEYFDNSYYLNKYLLKDLTDEKPYYRWCHYVKAEVGKLYHNHDMDAEKKAFEKYDLKDFMLLFNDIVLNED